MKRLYPFTSNEIKPCGWIKRQLEIQAEGLCGNLDLVWPDVADSKWIGGSRDGWERVPYWLDGFIPMAYLLEREDHIKRAKRYIDAIIDNQAEDGWLCPCTHQERASYDIWAFMLICKTLSVYADCSKNESIEQVLRKAFDCMYKHIKAYPLFNWGQMRWYECLIPIFWLYDKTKDEWLIELAKELKRQSFDHDAYFDNFTDMKPKNEWRYDTHVVNLAMCLKDGALFSLIDGSDPNTFAEKELEILEEYHSMASFHFTGDECLAGDSPIRGSELCGVVEAMYSYEKLLECSGSVKWGDRLERLAFNALPAAVSEDMWTHQYDQMTNQPECSILPEGKVVFGTNNGESHLFGLEPNYGCCTANFGQGWPKLVLSSFMRDGEGIAATVLVPAEVSFNINGNTVSCICETDYPFKGNIKYIISAEKPVEFPFSVRIPAFADMASINGKEVETGQFHTIKKVWSGSEEINIVLSFTPRLVNRPRELFCLVRGPLLYALPVEADWVMREYETNGVPRRYPYCDYELFPTAKWNYGFTEEAFTVKENSISSVPFSEKMPPVEIETKLAEVEWSFRDGVCGETPDCRKPITLPLKRKFIPYGCTKLRMTELPQCEKS